MNFLGPVLNSDGTPCGPQRFRDIVKERYYITKHTHTSYSDIGQMTPLERKYILELITNDLQARKKQIDELSNRK